MKINSKFKKIIVYFHAKLKRRLAKTSSIEIKCLPQIKKGD